MFSTSIGFSKVKITHSHVEAYLHTSFYTNTSQKYKFFGDVKGNDKAYFRATMFHKCFKSCHLNNNVDKNIQIASGMLPLM